MSDPDLYEAEVRDLVAYIDAFAKARDAVRPELLYIDAIEITVGADGGANDLFKIWWDGEIECFRIERKQDEAAS
jgi:hypothetical protein